MIALALLVGGCGSDDGGDDTTEAPPAAGLVSGVEGVSIASTDDPVAFDWVDVARLREAAGIPADATKAATNSRWSIPVGYALGDPLGNLLFSQEFGFDPMTGDRTVGAGTAPNRATFYGGVDAGDVPGALDDLGYDETDGFYANGKEGAILPGSPSLTGTNRFAIDGDDLSVGAFEAPVGAAIGRGGDALATLDGVAAASDCLGADALMANVRDPEDGAADEVALQAIGVEGPGDDGVVPEVLCAVGEPGESLGDVADCMDGNFNDGGVDPFSNRPFSDLLGKVEVSEGETDGAAWVRAIVSPPVDQPVGILFNLDSKTSLAGPLGGDPYAFSGGTVTPAQIEALEDQLPDVC